VSDDDVVENFDLEKLAGSDEIAGDFDVRLGWSRIAARMIVLCDAPIYVQSRIGSIEVNSVSTAKGVLCNALTRSNGQNRARWFAC